MNKSLSRNTTNTTLLVFAKMWVFGILVTQTYYLSVVLGSRISEYIIRGNHERIALAICAVCLLLVRVYVFERDFISTTEKLIMSRRVDILVAFSFGILASTTLKETGTRAYASIASALSIEQLLVLVALPFVVGILLLIRVIQARFSESKKDEAPFFVNDSERISKNDDLLDFSEKAERFATSVLNQGSSDSVVFGVDAPWGIGKSTFVNFCIEHWKTGDERQTIVYAFNPLRYEDRAKLLENFIDGLIRIIKKEAFIPEIRPLISKYSRFIKGSKGKFSGFGFEFEIFPGPYTIDDAFEDLEEVLSNLDRQIIIVVDDLDRLEFSEITDVLFAIKKSFTLSNISYVLCYDTENISAAEKERPDLDKVTEFLEKFINVKVGLYLDSAALKRFVSKNLAKALAGNSQANPILVSKAISGLTDIYDAADYHHYLPFIGDIRKLKRLINILLLLEIEQTDFDNSDLNTFDLIHLLLIYINYPTVFRKIYNTETRGKRGFFSALVPGDDAYPKQGSTTGAFTYENSNEYVKYIKSLGTENQKFLVNKVFDLSQRFESRSIENVSKQNKHSCACFNGGLSDGRNLEEYLSLIVNLSKPPKGTQYRFYLNCIDEIVGGKTVENVLSGKQFTGSTSEGNHEQFWRIVTNTPDRLDGHAREKLITYLLNNIQDYSAYGGSSISAGLRNDLDYFLASLLNSLGRGDGGSDYPVGSEDSLVEIAEWVFGEGRHTKSGVIETLGKEDRGLLGLHDLLGFRLKCSVERVGTLFDLQCAISKHHDPNAPTAGPTRDIAIAGMREISQKVFQVFENQYIRKHKNIFNDANALSLQDFVGKYQAPVKKQSNSGENNEQEASIGVLKTDIFLFITYQLGSATADSGPSCGYYDPTGTEDKHGIKVRVGDYLFNECFDPALGDENYQHFLDYLLMNFTRTHTRSGTDHVPSINGFTEVLDRNRLATYWKEHKERITNLELTERDKVVLTSNYTASYKQDLAAVYLALDLLVLETDKELEEPRAPLGPS